MNKESQVIFDLISLLIKNKVINKDDKIFSINYLLGILNIEKYSRPLKNINHDLLDLVNQITTIAINKSLIKSLEKDNFIDRTLGILMQKPSQVIHNFNEKFQKGDKELAFYNFYELSKNSYYIKYDRTAKNKEWIIKTDFGSVVLTINVSKPTKTLEEIINYKNNRFINYPKCVLCKENVGSFGNLRRNSRQNLRIILLVLAKEKMFVHYSPYEYFKEHLIVNSYEHKNMEINQLVFKQLIEFVDMLPSYFLGSNANIIRVGGSILNHKHFQGGKGNFPIFQSKSLYIQKENKIELHLLDWPLSTIKLVSDNKQKIINHAIKIFTKWEHYSNKHLKIINKNSKGEKQNSITPLVRKNNDKFEMYLILRNNGISKKYPKGIFHVHKDIWNIKYENIGIIEAMGQAILPSSLLIEIPQMIKAYKANTLKLPKNLAIHQKWFQDIVQKFNGKDFKTYIYNEIGLTFAKGLKQCGVFKQKDFVEFKKFVFQ